MAIVLAGVLASPLRGAILVEDFEDGGAGGFDPAFKHQLLPVPPNTEAYWELDGAVLWLYPAIDEVTFNLAPGQHVEWASVTLVDHDPGGSITGVEFVGTAGSVTFPAVQVGVEETYDTTGLNLGEIQMIRLASYEGWFDDLTIDVVPEPATAMLLALTGLALPRRRR
jgi:hypothetical protein